MERRALGLALAILCLLGHGVAQARLLQPIDPNIARRSEADRARRFDHMERFYTGRRVAAGGTVRPLPAGRPLALDEGMVDEFMARAHVAALIVVQDGRVRLERYAPGRGVHSRWATFSVTKSVTSTLVGAALRDGAIRSLDDPVTRYLPSLAGSAYDRVAVRDLLTMRSGVDWSEDYADPAADVSRLYRWTPPPDETRTLGYMRRLRSKSPPGTDWHYDTGETDLVGELVMAATHRHLATYLSRAIWRRWGMADDAWWLTDADGREPGGSGLSMTIRDAARFGLLALESNDLLPTGWFAAATSPQVRLDDKGDGYGYLWWTYPEERFAAHGIFGQSIAVDRPRRLVIAIAADWPHATDPALSAARDAFERAVATASER